MPNPMYFIPAATDEDNPPDVVPGEFDIWNTYVGRDKENIYLAAKMDGNIDPGSEDFPYTGVYAVKFSNPAIEQSEGLLIGKLLAFSPMIFPAPLIYDIASMLGEGAGAGRIMDACIGGPNDLTQSISMARDVIFYKVRIKDICPDGCDALRIIHITANMNDEDNFMPYPYNCSPFLYIYFRSHSIGPNVDSRIRQPIAPQNGIENYKPVSSGFIYKKYLQLMEQSVSEEQFIQILRSYYSSDTYSQLSSIPLTNITPGHITYYHEGPGPFYVTPCDVAKYKNYRFEVYTRNRNLKVRIFRDGVLLHTLMINEHTKPRRDEQHKTDDIYITLSNFYRKDMSCTITIEDLK